MVAFVIAAMAAVGVVVAMTLGILEFLLVVTVLPLVIAALGWLAVTIAAVVVRVEARVVTVVETLAVIAGVVVRSVSGRCGVRGTSRTGPGGIPTDT